MYFGMKPHIDTGSRTGLVPKAKDFTIKRAYRNRPLSEADKATNWRKSKIRAKVEHLFLVLKRLWGLAKNANRALAMLTLVNLVKWGRYLTGEVRPK
jgi:IS5 family transposase